MTANTTASARRPLVPTVVRVVISAARSGVGYSVRRPVRRVRPPDATPRARMPGETGRRKPGCLGTIERATINRVEVG